MNARNNKLDIGPRDLTFHVELPQTKEQLAVKDGQHRRLVDVMMSKKSLKINLSRNLLNESGEPII